MEDIEVRELGESLFTTLFDERLSREIFGFYEMARDEDALLRVELDVDEQQLPDVAALPWEFMRVPSDAGYGTVWLGTAPDLVFSRRRARWTAPKPILLKPGERLRIALAVAAPDELGPVKYEKIWDSLQQLASNQVGQIELLELVNPATIVSIDALLEQKPHIFHFIGHARLKNKTRQAVGQIALVDNMFDTPIWIGGERFGELFNRHEPSVVVLQACEGAALSASKAFVGVASQVIEQNIPVIVAMQYQVSNSTARRFALEFYRRLSKNEPVDKAAQEGRRRIALEPAGYTTRDFGTPVLFMNVRDGHLFQRSITDQSIKPTKRKTSSMQYVNRDEEIDIFHQYLSSGEYSLILVEGESGTGKTALISQFERILQQEDLLFCFVNFRKTTYTPIDVIDLIIQAIGHEYFTNLKSVLREFIENNGLAVKDNPLSLSARIAIDAELNLKSEHERNLWYRHITTAFFQDIELSPVERLVVLIDTYEQCSEMMRVWLSTHMLPSLRKQRRLLVVLTGQTVPTLDAEWADHHLKFALSGLGLNYWEEYVRNMKAELPHPEWLKAWHFSFQGKPAAMITVLETFMAEYTSA